MYVACVYSERSGHEVAGLIPRILGWLIRESRIAHPQIVVVCLRTKGSTPSKHQQPSTVKGTGILASTTTALRCSALTTTTTQAHCWHGMASYSRVPGLTRYVKAMIAARLVHRPPSFQDDLMCDPQFVLVWNSFAIATTSSKFQSRRGCTHPREQTSVRKH